MTFSQKGRKRELVTKKILNSIAFCTALTGSMYGLKSECSQHVLPRPTASSTAGQFLPQLVSLILMSHLFSNGSHPEAEVSSFCEVSTGTAETLQVQ